MDNQTLIKEIFKQQEMLGNNELSRDDIEFILNQLTSKSINLMRKKDLLQSQKTKVDHDLIKTEKEITKNKNRLEFICQNKHKVSILLKKQQSKRYIKGRFWWEGKQRDVQIGSENTIISSLKNLYKNKIIGKIITSSRRKISWNSIKKNKELYLAVSKIGNIKASGYVLKKIKNEIFKIGDFKKQKNVDKSYSVPKNDTNLNLDWYSDWKNKNFEEL